MHEIFHATSANNRSDHNKIQLLPSSGCGTGGIDDRVVLLTSLCTNTRLLEKENSSEKGRGDAIEILSRRMAECKMGCHRVFTKAGNNYNFFKKTFVLKSKDLSEKSADFLCKKIQADNSCKQMQKLISVDKHWLQWNFFYDNSNSKYLQNAAFSIDKVPLWDELYDVHRFDNVKDKVFISKINGLQEPEARDLLLLFYAKFVKLNQDCIASKTLGDRTQASYKQSSDQNLSYSVPADLSKVADENTLKQLPTDARNSSIENSAKCFEIKKEPKEIGSKRLLE